MLDKFADLTDESHDQEAEEYDRALSFTLQDQGGHWTADLLKRVIKSYGDAAPDQRVTVDGVPTDVRQRKDVDWWTKPRADAVGEVWYDLNIDGLASDKIVRTSDGYMLRLRDVHVM